jgi:hypothetical protein
LLKFKKVFAKGGLKRMKYTVPALVFSIIRLTQVINFREANPVQGQLGDQQPLTGAPVTQKRLFKLLGELLALIQATYPEMALRLNLQAV